MRVVAPSEPFRGLGIRHYGDYRKQTGKGNESETVDEGAAAREERKKIVGSGHAIVEEIEDHSKKSGIKKVGKL